MTDFFRVWRDLLGLTFLLDNGKVSNSKVAVLFVAILVGVIVWRSNGVESIQWFLFSSFMAIIAGAMGRTVFTKFIDAKTFTGSATHSTAITGDAAAIIKAASEAVAARRDAASGTEPTP